MSFRKKKDTQKSFGKQGDVEETVSVRTYAPHLGLTPRDYMMPQLLADFETGFERRAKEFLQNANPDQYNGSYMDGVICKLRDEALVELSLQRADHVGSIADLISKLWNGDQIKAQAKLEQCTAELEETDRELAKLRRVYHRGTSLSDEEEEMNEV